MGERISYGNSVPAEVRKARNVVERLTDDDDDDDDDVLLLLILFDDDDEDDEIRSFLRSIY